MLEHVTPDMCSGFVDLTVSFPTEPTAGGGANSGAHVWSSHHDRCLTQTEFSHFLSTSLNGSSSVLQSLEVSHQPEVEI